MEPTDHEFVGIEFECPECKTALDEYREKCPRCGRALDDQFCATYRPATPTAVKVIALVLLVLLVGSVVVPLAVLLWRFLFHQ